MDQGFGICTLSLAPVRAEASDRSEMISQLLFGDYFQILERSDSWLRICAQYDEYEGWVDFKQIVEIEEDLYNKVKSDAVLGLQLTHEATQLCNNEIIHLLSGSTLPFYNDGIFHLNHKEYTINGSVSSGNPKNFASGIESVARFYLNAPYLWGGRSPFGIDCSGYTQIVFKQFGICLKRDARQQALQGNMVGFLQEARAGDLAFFDNEEGRITHVGIMLNDHEIIHASGRVKIDKIDNQGIFSADLGRYSHRLRIIKRYI
ncbi:MAG TPA: C40 family peptidase [Sphingobacteriaceae bacterium]|nr:C40 family peptidase [Sphingobacteriaceae bacterium]